jgi:RNA polymerase sigma-70 factor (ECF subfamily)
MPASRICPGESKWNPQLVPIEQAEREKAGAMGQPVVQLQLHGKRALRVSRESRHQDGPADVRAIGSAVAGLSGGEEEAFRNLIEPHRPALHAHCYRMLGSLHDAEDALQNTLLRAWRALPSFRGRSSLRVWLYRIATNVCLDAIARRPRRVLPIDYEPPMSPGDATEKPLSVAMRIESLPDETLAAADGDATPEARYERREALELAFIAALRHLSARQRAVLILRDVLGFSAREVADSLETTVASVNGAVRRARRAVSERLPEQSRHAALHRLGDRRMREIVERFADAVEQGEIDAVLALLTEDAMFAKRTDGRRLGGPFGGEGSEGG